MKMSDECIKPLSTPNNIHNRLLAYVGAKTMVRFNGNCLKRDKATLTHETIVNIYIVYKLSKNFNIDVYPTLENCLFGEVRLTKNSDIIDK